MISYQRITVLIPVEMAKALKGRSISTVIREALAEYLKIPLIEVKRGRPKDERIRAVS